MLIKNVDHFTINVVKREKSIQFYEGVLELKKLNEIDMGDHGLTYFYLNEYSKLELIEYFNENKGINVPVENKGSYRHLALVTDDLGAVFKRCQEYHVVISMEPVYVEKLNCKCFMILDPNGVEIEIIERVI